MPDEMGRPPPKRAGRKRKRVPEREAKILELLRVGNTRRTAHLVAGVSETTFYDWLASDPAFSERVKEAEEYAAARYLAQIAKAATGGTWQAAAWWLERRRAEDYRQRSDPAATATATATAAATAKASVHDVLLQSAAELREEMARLEPAPEADGPEAS